MKYRAEIWNCGTHGNFKTKSLQPKCPVCKTKKVSYKRRHTKNKTELYEEAISKWDKEFQILMVIEEMAELTQALIKYFRGKKPFENSYNIAEEMADVEIMLEQLKIICGNAPLIELQKEKKLKKLQKLLEEKNESHKTQY